MAAFTHLNPWGSRFTAGDYGLYYAAAEIETAVAETRHHRARFLAATAQGPIELDMLVYAASLRAELHDIRPEWQTRPELYDPDDYSASQRLGRELRESGSWGIWYRSVRRPAGECFAVLRPPALSNCRQERHLAYVWDGKAIVSVYEKRAFDVDG
ncbi:MAG: hypothetical protein JWO25_1306 [Alphaproteobacteria bacterium]|nr:hypothetical protein [Alphaproteobacteria bacterium]